MRRLLLAIMAVSVLAGCSSNSAGIAMRSDSDSLRVDSSSVASEVTISQVKQRFDGGLLRGSAVIGSSVSSDRYWQYKFTFFDAEGVGIEVETSPWIPLNLHGGEQRSVQATAPNSSANSFELVVRPGPDQ